MVALNAAAPDASLVVGGSAEAFGALVDPHRRELLVHCYRMLGSIDDAEDAVQDALVRAWHGRATFQRSISFRAWLYRIATNACLDAIERRKRGRAREEHLGVGPFPDQLLGGTTPGPEARYDARESISLAFLEALQVLPPRQRAVLILRDVLSWHAAEVATLLDLSIPAVNSALQRARSTLAARDSAPRSLRVDRRRSEPGHLRSLVERYVRAWESADVAGLVALLRDDAVLSMPPGAPVSGAALIGAFLSDSVFRPGRRRRLVPTSANGGPAFVAYASSGADVPLRIFAVLVLSAGDQGIERIDAFFDPRQIAPFGAPERLAG
jgi:RNA polymerase sigma-70 factor (TIGR02960 family)